MLFMFVRLFLKSGGVPISFQFPSGASHGQAPIPGHYLSRTDVVFLFLMKPSSCMKEEKTGVIAFASVSHRVRQLLLTHSLDNSCG